MMADEIMGNIKVRIRLSTVKQGVLLKLHHGVIRQWRPGGRNRDTWGDIDDLAWFAWT